MIRGKKVASELSILIYFDVENGFEPKLSQKAKHFHLKGNCSGCYQWKAAWTWRKKKLKKEEEEEEKVVEGKVGLVVALQPTPLRNRIEWHEMMEWY